MTTYLVQLKGKNFLVNDAGDARKRSFRATRLVEAENQSQASALARELIRKDPRLKETILNDASDPPVITIDGIREISAMAYDAQNRAQSFYWEND